MDIRELAVQKKKRTTYKKKYRNKFEKQQAYIVHKKTKELKELAVKFRIELLDLETPTEVMFKSYLLSLKVKYEFQKIVYAGKSFYIVDFYLPKKNIVIEIDGRQHSNPENIEKDKDRTINLKGVGVKEVYRFTNDDIYKYKMCMNRIKSIIKNEKVYRRNIKT